MSFWIVLIILVPILFVIGTIYNALKEQKKLEEGELKNILEQRAKLKAKALKLKNTDHSSKS